MEDFNRLLALMKYCSDQVNYVGFETLYDVVANKVPFNSSEQDIEGAYEVAYHILHTLYDVEFKDQMVFGKPKLSMEGLLGDLVLLLERVANYKEGQTDGKLAP